MSLYDFNTAADVYDDYYSTEMGHMIDIIEKRLVLEFLKKIPVGSMLEVGCGTGHWSAFFCENGFTVTGVDISEKMLDRAIHRQLPHCYFAPGNAEELIFQEHTFDHVAAMAVLEFVQDQDRALNEIHRVLKPGGYFLVGALNKNSWLARSDDAVVSSGNLFTPDLLLEKLCNFGEPEVHGCALMDENGELLDFKNPDLDRAVLDAEGGFLVGLVKKIH
jgi:ubiquinone/menaquinone biosynthesis C-methylase UbiE